MTVEVLRTEMMELLYIVLYRLIYEFFLFINCSMHSFVHGQLVRAFPQSHMKEAKT